MRNDHVRASRALAQAVEERISQGTWLDGPRSSRGDIKGGVQPGERRFATRIGFVVDVHVLLGDVAAAQVPPQMTTAIERFTAAIGIAEELGLRPLLARTQLALGQLHRRGGQVLEAEAHLATAVVLFSDLGMRAWLDRTEPELRALGHLVIVAKPNVNLYEYLKTKFAGDPNGQVVLDRRHGEPRPDAGASVERRAADRRRIAIDQALRSRGLAVVLPPR